MNFYFSKNKIKTSSSIDINSLYKMKNYNIMPKETFEALTQKDPKFILKYMMEFAEASRHNPDLTLVVPFSSIPKDPILTTDVAVKDFGWLFVGEGKCRFAPLPDDKVMLKKMKMYLQQSDFSFDGYVAAGSSVVLACGSKQLDFGSPSPHDIDMFPFYDPTQVREVTIQDQIMDVYRRFLGEMDEICEKLKGEGEEEEDEDYKKKMTSITRRTEYCTTIWSPAWAGGSTIIDEIQMIHRAYSSAVATVVGFDQMACKAFFDGEMAYFTIDAALCLYFGINPIDWRRESPNHLRRAQKYYEYGFAPIFPGLPFSLGGELMSGQHSNLIGKSIKCYLLPSCFLMAKIDHYRKNGDDEKPHLIFIFDRSWNETLEPTNEGDHEPVKRLEYRRDGLEGGGEKESDYDMEGPYVHEDMAYAYRGLSMLIKDKPDFVPVFSLMSNDIIDKCNIIPIRHILEKVYPGEYSKFYFGNNDVYNTYLNLVRLKLKNHGRGNVSFKILKGKDKKQSEELERQLEELINNRSLELEEKANKHLATMKGQVRFITNNPGAQFTSSFHPITRRNAREYWGRNYQHYNCSDFIKAKFTILLMKRFRDCVWKRVDNNVIKIIFRYLYSYHFMALVAQSENRSTIDRRISEICSHKLLPWITPEPCNCPTKIVKLEKIADDIQAAFVMEDPFVILNDFDGGEIDDLHEEDVDNQNFEGDDATE